MINLIFLIYCTELTFQVAQATVTCKLDGIYVMLKDRTGGSVSFKEEEGWLVTSPPDHQHILCEVYLNPTRSCQLDQFQVGFSDTKNSCSPLDARYTPQKVANEMYQVYGLGIIVELKEAR
ncbi:hypothetical protein ACOME3_003031 [Neoechinorhynchus agilis]